MSNNLYARDFDLGKYRNTKRDGASAYQIDAYIKRDNEGNCDLFVDRIAVLDGNVRTNISRTRITEDQIHPVIVNGVFYATSVPGGWLSAVIPVREIGSEPSPAESPAVNTE